MAFSDFKTAAEVLEKIRITYSEKISLKLCTSQTTYENSPNKY